MKHIGIVACLIFSTGTAFGQQYVISTIAGGAPPPTPTTTISPLTGGINGGVAVDTAGNVYFTYLFCVFKVDRNGTVTRIAGNSRAGYSGDGGLATNAMLSYPSDLAVDGVGNIYIADGAYVLPQLEMERAFRR